MSVDRLGLKWNMFMARSLRLSRRQLRLLEAAADEARIDSRILESILRTEMTARPACHRACEFAGFTLLCFFAPHVAGHMTLGPAQIRVHSVAAEGRLRVLHAGCRLMTWEYALEQAASRIAAAPGGTVEAICACYNGSASSENYVAIVRALAQEA